MPKRIVRIIRKRITRALHVEIEFSSIHRDLGRGLGRALERTLDSTLDLVPLDSPRRIIRGVRRRARVVLRANLRLSNIQRGLSKTMDRTIDRIDQIDQIPMKTTKGIARIVHRRAIKVLQTDVSLSEIQRGLSRTLVNTLDLMPLDADLLVKQGAARSKQLNRQLAWSLAFVAGAVNAGGFLAVQSYTSHVTGAVSRAADELALGHTSLALAALAIVTFFALGAFCAGLLISLGRRRRFQSHYALSLMLEGGLLLVFGLMGSHLQEMHRFFLPLTVILLSFIMGMHNSVVTTISDAEVRTTHLTGIVTDLGLELSRLFYFNVDDHHRLTRVMGNRDKLKLHGLVLASFFGGGVVGAIGFRHVGFKMTIFLAAFLFLLAWRPVLRELRVRFRLIRG